MSNKPTDSADQDSWERFPEIKVRLAGNKQLKALIAGLNKPDGSLSVSTPKFFVENNNIYITIFTNTGKYPDILPVSIDIRIPLSPEESQQLEPKIEVESSSNNQTSVQLESSSVVAGRDSGRLPELSSGSLFQEGFSFS
jgi:hypothetical protein